MSGVIHIGPEFVSGSDRLSAAAKAKAKGLCGKAWRDINIVEAAFNPAYGGFWLNRGETFGTNANNAFSTTLTGSGTALYKAGGAGFPTLLELDAVSTTNGEGVNLQYNGQGFYPQAGMVSAGSTMIRFKDIATAPEFFFGLATIDASIIASDAISATDWMGFFSLSGGTIKFGSDDGSEDAGANTLHTMVDGATTTDGTEWVNLDWRWEVGSKFEVYIDGVLGDISDVAITAEPDGHVVPSFVLQTNGTTDPIADVVYSAFGYRY